MAKESFITVVNGLLYLFGGGKVTRQKKRFKNGHGLVLFRRHAEGQDVFIFPPPHGQYAVRRGFFNGFRPIKIVFVFCAFIFLLGIHFGNNNALFKKELPHHRPCFGVFSNPFSDDVPCPRKGVFIGKNVFFGIHKGGCNI